MQAFLYMSIELGHNLLAFLVFCTLENPRRGRYQTVHRSFAWYASGGEPWPQPDNTGTDGEYKCWVVLRLEGEPPVPVSKKFMRSVPVLFFNKTSATRVPCHPWTRTTPVFEAIQWMKFTSLLQPFHATSIHSGVFVGFVRQRFFFLFLGWIFLPLCDKKIRYDSYKWLSGRNPGAEGETCCFTGLSLPPPPKTLWLLVVSLGWLQRPERWALSQMFISGRAHPEPGRPEHRAWKSSRAKLIPGLDSQTNWINPRRARSAWTSGPITDVVKIIPGPVGLNTEPSHRRSENHPGPGWPERCRLERRALSQT
jgi:hypothetical protein